jgi:hypothetical protein
MESLFQEITRKERRACVGFCVEKVQAKNINGSCLFDRL